MCEDSNTSPLPMPLSMGYMQRIRKSHFCPSSKFPAFSALKCLQNSSIIYNNSEVSLNEVKNFVTGSHIKCFCSCLIFTYKGTKYL